MAQKFAVELRRKRHGLTKNLTAETTLIRDALTADQPQKATLQSFPDRGSVAGRRCDIQTAELVSKAVPAFRRHPIRLHRIRLRRGRPDTQPVEQQDSFRVRSNEPGAILQRGCAVRRGLSTNLVVQASSSPIRR